MVQDFLHYVKHAFLKRKEKPELPFVETKRAKSLKVMSKDQTQVHSADKYINTCTTRLAPIIEIIAQKQMFNIYFMHFSNLNKTIIINIYQVLKLLTILPDQ